MVSSLLARYFILLSLSKHVFYFFIGQIFSRIDVDVYY